MKPSDSYIDVEFTRPDIARWLADPKQDGRDKNKKIGLLNTRRNTKRKDKYRIKSLGDKTMNPPKKWKSWMLREMAE